MSSNNNDRNLELSGSKITEDENGNICLNDLWIIAGKPKDLRPAQWKRQKRTKALESALIERIVFLKHNPSKNEEITTFYVQGRGGNAKSFAHPVLALEYAENLSPPLGIQVREIFLKYKSNDISLANEILDRIAEQVQEDELRLHNREEITLRNKELAAEGKKAGCKGWEYAELHNSGYRGLYNGLDKEGIRQLKKLTANQNILDHMDAAEGAANVFRVTQAKIAMQQQKPTTSTQAFKIAHDAGVETRKAMKQIGGVMPEDMKPADSISKAKKRLAANKPLIEQSKNNN